ncbi:GGDEF domain-containing protein [Pleomorphochaeta sp. DL1XJH-081]|uniref:GGDEF domain-containing protein n=1 Tax=Pleomorphochaeta sp. DL1XJH-081 TaxID=3409690 RepID=UPI003BB5B0FE
MTGLHNRLWMTEQFDPLLKTITRMDKQLCLVVLDIDGFKDLNDAYGHQFGDDVLRHVGKTIR